MTFFFKANVVIALIALFSINYCYALDSSKGYNIDFIHRESGGVGQASSEGDYEKQWPSLGGPTNTQVNRDHQFPSLNPVTPKPQGTVIRDYVAPRPTQTPPAGKRDYVAPQSPTQGTDKKYDPFPPLNPISSTTPKVVDNKKRDYITPQPTPKSTSGRRDYVAPQRPTQGIDKKYDPFPPLGPIASTTPKVVDNNKRDYITPQPTPKSTSGRRDYVAPQVTSPKPLPQGSPAGSQPGKVKDLINFFNIDSSPNGAQKPPNYSTILKGSSSATNSITTKMTTPKPFSSVVAGNKPSSIGPTVTTKPPSTTQAWSRPATQKPGTTVLPSSILTQNNKKDQNSGSITDLELQTLSEELLRKDTNNAAKYITVNYQEKTSSGSKEDKAPNKLFTIGNEVWNILTVQKFVPLLDNYERDTLVNEYVTPQERNEENAFMDAIMSTTVIRHLMTFLKEKGYVTPDPRQQRDFLKQLWFSLYSRGKGKISSSGFEHIFVSELKNGEVSGLHNWIYFAKEESANRANYLGYLKKETFNDKGAVLKLHFTQQGSDKPVDTMFVGTSPELEMALYTLCFVTRADNDCKLKLGGKDIGIITHTFRYRSKNLIGSGYPQI